jgi:hypothetical protein
MKSQLGNDKPSDHLFNGLSVLVKVSVQIGDELISYARNFSCCIPSVFERPIS